MHCNRSGFNVCSNGTPGQDLGCCPGYYYLPNCAVKSGKCCFPVEESRRLDFLEEEVHPQDLLLQELTETHRAETKKRRLLSASVADRQDDQLIQARVVMEDRFLQEEEDGGGDEYGVTAQLVGSGGTNDSGDASSGAIIFGAIAGVAVVAMAVAFVMIRRARREEDEQDEDCRSKKTFGTSDEESAGDVAHLAQ